MSATLLQRVRNHLDGGNLLDGYEVQYFRYRDSDEKPKAAVFRTPGTGGALSDFSVQYPDVMLVLVAHRFEDQSLSERGREIYQYVRENFLIEGGLNIEPITATPAGPFHLTDDRPWIQLDFRVIVSDH